MERQCCHFRSPNWKHMAWCCHPFQAAIQVQGLLCMLVQFCQVCSKLSCTVLFTMRFCIEAFRACCMHEWCSGLSTAITLPTSKVKASLNASLQALKCHRQFAVVLSGFFCKSVQNLCCFDFARWSPCVQCRTINSATTASPVCSAAPSKSSDRNAACACFQVHAYLL